MGDIGLMGAPAKLDGKAVEGVKIFLGGRIGENPEVGARPACWGLAGVAWPTHCGLRTCSSPHASPASVCFLLSQLAKEFEKGIPCDESVLLPRLRELLISEFGATPKQASAGGAPASEAVGAGA